MSEHIAGTACLGLWMALAPPQQSPIVTASLATEGGELAGTCVMILLGDSHHWVAAPTQSVSTTFWCTVGESRSPEFQPESPLLSVESWTVLEIHAGPELLAAGKACDSNEAATLRFPVVAPESPDSPVEPATPVESAHPDQPDAE
jgi:hypothetical protein